jgi:hypothetical protein
MAVLLGMNVATVMLFGYELVGLQWLDIFESAPVNILGLAAVVAFHLWLIGRIQRRDVRAGYAEVDRKASAVKHLWLWYLVTSVALLFMGVVLAIRR